MDELKSNDKSRASLLKKSECMSSILQTDSSMSLSKATSGKSNTQKPSMDSFQSMDISDITMEIEKLGKLAGQNPSEALRGNSKLIRDIDQQMEISFEIIEERQNMVLEYLRERERAEKQSKRRADEIMKQFTTKMTYLDNTMSAELSHEKIIKSMITQTDCISTRNQALQTTFSDSVSPKSKQNTARYLPTETFSLPDELDLLSNKSMEERVYDKKNENSLPLSTSEYHCRPTVELSPKENKNMTELRKLCRHMDNLEHNLDEAYNILERKLNLPPFKIEELIYNVKSKSPRSGQSKVNRQLKLLEKDKKLHKDDITVVRKKLFEIKNAKEKITKDEDKLKDLLKHKFSLGSPYPTSTIVSTNLCTHEIMSQTITEKENSAYSFQKDSLATVSTERDFSKSERFDLISELSTHEEEEMENYINGIFMACKTDDEKYNALKTEKDICEKKLAEIAERAKENAYQIKIRKVEKKQIAEKKNKLTSEKESLENKVKTINKTIYEKLLVNEKEKEKKEAERRLSDVTKHIKTLECNLSDASTPRRSSTESSKSEYINQLKFNLNMLIPYVTKLSPKYYRKAEKTTAIPKQEEINGILKQRSELSKKLLQTENQIQMIITSKDFVSDDEDNTVTTISEFSKQHEKTKSEKNSELEKEKTEINEAIVQLEIELHELNPSSTSNEDALNNEITSLKKKLIEVQRLIKVASQIPRPIEENKQLKILKEEIDLLMNECKNQGITNFTFNRKYLDSLKLKKKEYEGKVEKIRNRIENENIHGKNIGNVLKDMLYERHRLTSVNLQIQNDIDNLSYIKSLCSENESMEEQLQIVEKEILHTKSKNVHQFLMITRTQINEFLASLKTNLELQLEEKNEEDEKDFDESEKTKIKMEFISIKSIIEKIIFDLKALDSNQIKATDIELTTNDVRKVLTEKIELLKILSQVNQSIENKIATTHNKELLKKLLKKKMEVKEQLLEIEEKIKSQKFLLKEKLKKYMIAKKNLEIQLENIGLNDIQSLLDTINGEQNQKNINDNLFSLVTERESVAKNLLHTLNTKEDERGNSYNMSKVLDSLDAIIFNQLQNIVRQINDINSHTKNYVALTIDKDKLNVLLQCHYELNKIVENLDVAKCTDLQELETNFESEILTILEKKRKLVEDFYQRKLEVSDLETLMQFQELNNEKIDKLLNKIKNLNTLLQTQRRNKIQKNKAMHCSTNSTTKVLKMTAEKISKELESLVKSFRQDTTDEHTFQNKISSSLTSEKKDGLNILLQERDMKLHELFQLEHKMLQVTLGTPEFKELSMKKQSLEQDIDLLDNRIIDCDFSVTQETYIMPIARSFSPKSTSSRHSFVLALDERDTILKKLFELTRQLEVLKQSECYIESKCEIHIIKNEIDNLKNQIKDIDEKILDGATLDDESLNQTWVSTSCYTKDNLKKDIEGVKEELQTDKLKLHCPRQEENSSDIRDLITDPKERDIFDSLASTKIEIRKEKLKEDLISLEDEKQKLEDELRGRKSPDRMLLRKEEEEIKETLKEKEKLFFVIKRKKKIENDIKELKERKSEHEHHIDKVEEMKFNSFLKNEKNITMKEYKKNKVTLENELDKICIKMAQYSKSLEKEIKNAEKDISLTSTQHSYRKTIEWSFEIDDGLDALRGHQNELENYIVKLHNSGKEKDQDRVSMNSLLKQRSDNMKKITKLRENIKILQLENKEEIVVNNLKQLFNRSKEILKQQKILKLKISAIKAQMEMLSMQDNRDKFLDTEKLKLVLGEELLESILKNKKLDVLEEANDVTLHQYIQTLKLKTNKVHQGKKVDKSIFEEADVVNNEKKREINKQITEIEELNKAIKSKEEQIKELQESVMISNKEIQKQQLLIQDHMKESNIEKMKLRTENEQLQLSISKLVANEEAHLKNIQELQKTIRELKHKSIKNVKETFNKRDEDVFPVIIQFDGIESQTDAFTDIMKDIKALDQTISIYKDHAVQNIEKEMVLVEQIEKQEKLIVMKEIESKEAKNCINVLESNSNDVKSKIKLLQNIYFSIREEKDCLQKEMNEIKDLNSNIQRRCNSIENEIEQSKYENQMNSVKMETINNEISKSKAHRICNVMNEENLNDKQNSLCQHVNTSTNETLESILKEKKDLQVKMEALWNEIVSLKESLYHQKELDRKEKENLNEKLSIYIEKLEQDKKLKQNEAEELDHLKAEVEKYLSAQRSDEPTVSNLKADSSIKYNEVAQINNNAKELQNKIERQNQVEKTLRDKEIQLQTELNSLKDENTKLNRKVNSVKIKDDITLLKKDIISKKEIEMYCIPKENVVEKIFELQKLNVILELKTLFSANNLKDAEEKLQVYTSNKDPSNLVDMNLKWENKKLNRKLAEKNEQVNTLQKNEVELKNEVDRCKRIIFKKGRTTSSMSGYKESPSYDGEQITQENVTDLQANPDQIKKPKQKTVKEEVCKSENISDDVQFVVGKLLRVITDPVPAKPLECKTEYSKLKKEELIIQEVVSEQMMSDEAALESSNKQLKAFKDTQDRHKNEIKTLKEKLNHANQEIERLNNEKTFFNHDIDILKDDIKDIQRQKKLVEESKNRLHEKNVSLQAENNASTKTISNLKEKLEELRDKLNMLEEEITDLQLNYDTLKSTEKEMSKEKENLKMSLFKHQTELTNEQQKSKKIENEFCNLQKDAEINVDKITKLENDMKTVQTKLENSVKENLARKKDAQSNAIELQRKIHELQQHTEELENELENLNEENKNLNDQVTEMENIDAKKRQENDQLNEKLKQLRLKCDDYENKMFLLEKEKISLESKLADEFDDKNKNLKELHENLKNALASKTRTIENSKEVESKLNEKMGRLKDRIKQLEHDNETLAMRLEEQNNIKLANKNIKEELNVREKELNELKKDDVKTKKELTIRDEENKSLKMKIESLERICGDKLFVNLKSDMSDNIEEKDDDPCTQYIKSMLKERKTLDNILKEIYDENKTMEQQIKNVQENLNYMKKERDSKVNTLEDANKQLQKNIGEVDKAREDLMKENKELIDEINQYSQKVDSLDLVVQDLKKHEEKIKSENTKLKNELGFNFDLLKSSEKEITKLNQIIDEKDQSLSDLHSDLLSTKKTTDKIEEEIRVLSEEKYGAMNVIDQTQAENQKIQSELSKIHNDKSIVENEIESLKIELKKMSRGNDALLKENETKSKLNLEKEKELMDLKKLNKMLEQDVVKYNETIKKINREDAELIKELEAEKVSLHTQMNTQTQNIKNLKEREMTLQDECHKLDEQLDSNEQKLMKAEREVLILKEVLDSQKSVTDELKMQLGSERNAKKEIQDKLRNIINERNVLSDKYTKQTVELSFLRETVDNATSNNKEIQKQLDDLNHQVRKTNKEREVLQDEMAKESKLNETYEDNIFNLTQINKVLENDLVSREDTIKKLNENVAYLEDQKDKLTRNHDDLKVELIEIKDKYDSLTGRYNHEMSAVNKELSNAKKKLEEQRNEINHVNEHTEMEIKGQLKVIKEAFENEKNNQSSLINDLKDRLSAKMASANEGAWKKEIAELEQVKIKLENRCDELQNERQGLIQKLKETNDAHDKEVTDTRRQLTEKFKKNIDKLSVKSKDLSNEIIDMEKMKNQLELDRNSLLMENKRILAENKDLKKALDDRCLQLDEKERFDKIRESTLQFEVDGLKLENNELSEQIKNLKYQINKNDLYKHYEKEVQEQKKQLELSIREFEEEKTNFEANIEEIFMRSNEMYVKSEFEKNEKVASEKLKVCQEEKEKLNNEIVNLNKELLNAKTEMRRLKTCIHEKEEEYLMEEKNMLTKLEKEWKTKLDESNKAHAKEKAFLMALNQDDRYKFEQEMESLKLSLKEDTSKKLSEQREDFEKELKEHIYQYLRQNQEEVEELLDKNDGLKTEKLELIRQYENERVMLKRKHDSERYALVETIRRLLKNVMKFKAQKVKLKHSHRDEISDLEERFETEREKLEEKCEQEIELLRENLHRSQRFQEHRRLNNDSITSDFRYGPIRTKPEKESDAVSLNKSGKSEKDNLILPDIHEVVRIGDSSDDNNSDGDADFVRTQYESELRRETDALMKRLLEISDELDSLRSTT